MKRRSLQEEEHS